KVGFIGTGNMGLPMMRNVVAKGFAVTAYDTHGPALDAAVKAGATRGTAPAASARDCEIAITILPSAADVHACEPVPVGILEGAASKTLCIDMSTIDPGTAQRVADRMGEKQVRYIDAPVSGGTVKAAEGTLAIMVGGPASDFESARPVLASMGTNL